MKPKNIYAATPYHPEQELFEQLVKNKDVKIERIISKGHRSPAFGWYDQEKSEWILVLKGRAILSFENEAPMHLNEGDFVSIPPHKKHKVDWTDPDHETIWLAVHY